jgi:hypothetical protein
MRLKTLFNREFLRLGDLKAALGDDKKFGTTELWLKRRHDALADWISATRSQTREERKAAEKRRVKFYTARALMELLLVKQFREEGRSLEHSYKQAWRIVEYCGRYVEFIDLDKFAEAGLKLDDSYSLRIAFTGFESEDEVFSINTVEEYRQMVEATARRGAVHIIDMRPIFEKTCAAVLGGFRTEFPDSIDDIQQVADSYAQERLRRYAETHPESADELDEAFGPEHDRKRL